MSKETATTKKTLVPEIRFEGFSGEWGVHVLEDILELIDGDRGANYPQAADLSATGHTLFLSADNIKASGFSESKKQYIPKKKSESLGNGKVLQDDIIITSRGTVGNVAHMDESIMCKYPYIRINSGMLIVRNSKYKMVNSVFIEKYLKSEKGRNQIKSLVFGSAQPQLTKKDVLKFKLNYPDLEEQIRIGKFVQKIETSIDSKGKELSKLVQYKKAMLQKLFPKEGEKEPEMRFEGFEGEWEERKLGVIADINTGNKDLNESVERGSYPFFVRSDNIERIDSYSFDGEAILTAGDGRIGEVFHYINGKFDYHQRVYKISNFNKCDGKFVYYELQKNFRQHALSLNAKGTVSSLRRPMLTDYAMLLPGMEEQKLISKCFQVIDKNIQSKQAELKKLKQFKQAMLSKLFV